MVLYLNNKNFLQVSKILFTLLLFTTSCQLDQSLDNIRSKLFESEEGKAIVKSDEETVDEKVLEKKVKVDKKIKKKELKDNQLFIPEKIEDEKRILDFIKSGGKKNENEDTLFTQDKIEDDKRILDFFTGFFSSDDEESKNVETSEIVKSNQEKIVLKKPTQKFKIPTNEPTEKITKNNELGEVNLDEVNDEEDYEEDIVLDDYANINEEDDSINEKNNVADIVKKNDVSNNEKDSSKELNKDKTEEQKLAFFNIQRPKKDTKKKIRKLKNNYIGLLLPLTGDKRSAGSLVLNTFRYSLIDNPMDVVFKIYDTKGTADGVIDAAIKGKKDNVKTFIGPIFSYETKALKEKFVDDNSIVFFSLSPDLSNVSENIIVSGQNPEDQISCIVSDLKIKNISELLLINHKDRYGDIIKKSIQKNLSMLTEKNINLSLLEIDKNKDLNKEIRSISNFDRRKDILKNQKKKISANKDLSKEEKKMMLKKLDRQLTIDSPFDAIIVASEGDKLLEILSHLAFYDINANNTLIYGTSLWEDTFKTDPVFENTFFVTNLKKRSESFTKNYQDVFSKNPTSLNFHLFDLIDFVNEFKVYDEYPENKIHVGRFTNSQVKSGSLRRETYIKKNKGKNNTQDISSCRLDII
mgnify:CR=1 FL=1